MAGGLSQSPVARPGEAATTTPKQWQGAGRETNSSDSCFQVMAMSLFDSCPAWHSFSDLLVSRLQGRTQSCSGVMRSERRDRIIPLTKQVNCNRRDVWKPAAQER